jgi:hypothetical protein
MEVQFFPLAMLRMWSQQGVSKQLDISYINEKVPASKTVFKQTSE